MADGLRALTHGNTCFDTFHFRMCVYCCAPLNSLEVIRSVLLLFILLFCFVLFLHWCVAGFAYIFSPTHFSVAAGAG